MIIPEKELPVEEASEDVYDWKQHYWLAQPFMSKDFGEEVFRRFGKHATQWDTHTPVGEAVWTAYRVYHGLVGMPNGMQISSPVVSLMETGEFGEFLSLTVNQYRSLVRHKIAMITSERIAWDPQASTSDSSSAKQVTLCRNLLDYMSRAKLFEQKFADQMEMSEVTGSGFLPIGWDARAGFNGEGDVWAEVKAPWEVCHEKVRDYETCTWWIFTRMESRFDWIAHFADADPEKAKRISELDIDKRLTVGVRTSTAEDENEDRIPVLYVYANATKACPKGRLAVYAAEDIPLIDGPMPYGPYSPITRLCGGEYLGTSIPIANSWSLLPIQEAVNAAWSAIVTRLDLGAVPDITAPDGTEFEQGSFGGANLIKTTPGLEKPELLDLLQIPGALPNLVELFTKAGEDLFGINSVQRGNPNENITSGSMAALVQSMGVQFNSSEERAYVMNLEATGTNLVRVIQRCATEEQIISIAGQDEQWTTQKFIGEDLKQVLRVAVKTTSALMKTLTGRKEIADQLLVNKLIEDPRQYLQAIETGNLSPLFRSAVDQLTVIKEENERMLRGEQPRVLNWDHHALHVRDHLCQLNTDARYDMQRSELIQNHIQEHIDLWGQLSRESPDILEATGCPPLSQAFAVGQQAMQMGAGGQPIEQPAKVQPTAVPGSDEAKAPPGPKPAPKGQEPSQAGPSLPKPAKPPNQAQEGIQ
jgi:hypothetical protein